MARDTRCKPSAKTVYTFEPVGLDRFTDRKVPIASGQKVYKTQPAGCPRNGTMGHTYVADLATGEFLGLVLTNSLKPTKEKVQ